MHVGHVRLRVEVSSVRDCWCIWECGDKIREEIGRRWLQWYLKFDLNLLRLGRRRQAAVWEAGFQIPGLACSLETSGEVRQDCSVKPLRRVDSLWPHGLQHTRLPCPPNFWSLLELMSIELVMPSNHLILCRPLLLLQDCRIFLFKLEAVLIPFWDTRPKAVFIELVLTYYLTLSPAFLTGIQLMLHSAWQEGLIEEMYTYIYSWVIGNSPRLCK